MGGQGKRGLVGQARQESRPGSGAGEERRGHAEAGWGLSPPPSPPGSPCRHSWASGPSPHLDSPRDGKGPSAAAAAAACQGTRGAPPLPVAAAAYGHLQAGKRLQVCVKLREPAALQLHPPNHIYSPPSMDSPQAYSTREPAPPRPPPPLPAQAPAPASASGYAPSLSRSLGRPAACSDLWRPGQAAPINLQVFWQGGGGSRLAGESMSPLACSSPPCLSPQPPMN